MVLDATLLNTQHYKVKWSNPGKGVVLPLHLGVVAIEKGAFRSPLNTVANLTDLNSVFLHIDNLECMVGYSSSCP